MNKYEINGTPNQLSTIDVDVEKKIFLVNGEPFGKGCSGFVISCDTRDGFKVKMMLKSSIKLATYEINGKKKKDYTFEKRSQ